jgi:hypothetical protein
MLTAAHFAPQLAPTAADLERVNLVLADTEQTTAHEQIRSFLRQHREQVVPLLLSLITNSAGEETPRCAGIKLLEQVFANDTDAATKQTVFDTVYGLLIAPTEVIKEDGGVPEAIQVAAFECATKNGEALSQRQEQLQEQLQLSSVACSGVAPATVQEALRLLLLEEEECTDVQHKAALKLLNSEVSEQQVDGLSFLLPSFYETGEFYLDEEAIIARIIHLFSKSTDPRLISLAVRCFDMVSFLVVLMNNSHAGVLQVVFDKLEEIEEIDSVECT